MERLRAKDYEVEEASITDSAPIAPDARLVGFFFPVYAYALPRVVRRYLEALPKVAPGTQAFLVVTAGLEDEAGYSVDEGIKLLAEKNYSVVYADAIEMPANWTVAMNPPGKQEAARISEKGLAKAEAIVDAILAGRSFRRSFNYPARVSKARYYWDYWSFRYLGVAHLWRNFRTDADCNGCGTCQAVCPMGSITMKDDRPVWSKACEQCMRCVNMCSRKAIFQKGYGATKDRNRYMDALFERKIVQQLKQRAK
jgi:ferredoxin